MNEFLTVEFINWCNETQRTAARWQKTGAPQWAQDHVRLRHGLLPWEHWEGWQIDDDGLQSPQGDRYHYSLIRAIPYLLAASQERYRQNVREMTETATAAAAIDSRQSTSRPITTS